MRLYEITTPRRKITEAVGRDLQHVEDVIYIYGVDAALSAVNRLRELGKDSKKMTIKYDGSPAIIFGRDENGQFHYGDKYAKEPSNNSPEAIAALIMSKKYDGKGTPEADAKRKAFADSQSRIWKLYESATPKDFRGYVVGDLMWQRKPELRGNEYVVEPNTVTYFIDKNSELGRKMANSETGATLHFYQETYGGPKTPLSQDILQRLGNDSVTVLGPKAVVEVQVKMNDPDLEALDREIKTHAQAIDNFLAPMPGLSNPAADIYTYANSSRGEPSVQGFVNTMFPKFTDKKVANYKAKDVAGLDAIFNIMKMFVKVKMHVINQAEKPGLGGIGIRAVLKGTDIEGGEGLVDTGSDTPMKFVSPAFTNTNRNR